MHAVLTRTEALTSHPGLTRPTVPLWQETQHAAATDAAALAPTRSIPLMMLIERARCALGPEHSQRPMQIDLHDGSLSMPLESRPLIHALTRVLHNACRFSAHTHAVKVRSRMDWADGFDRVVITICDRGVGMTRAHQQHAFEGSLARRTWRQRPVNRDGPDGCSSPCGGPGRLAGTAQCPGNRYRSRAVAARSDQR